MKAALSLCVLLFQLCAALASDRVPVTNHYPHVAYARDARGHLKRNSSVRKNFMQLSGYATGRVGFEIDHIVPLKRGGFDCPCNLQWIPVSEKRIKDRWE